MRKKKVFLIKDHERYTRRDPEQPKSPSPEKQLREN